MYSVEKSKDFNFVKKFDYILFSTVILISFIGLLIAKSATLTRLDGGNKIMTMQIISLIIGIVFAFILSTIDYKDFKKLGIVLYFVSVILLVAVLVIGTGDSLGSRSWIKISSFSFQPSEIAKIAYIMVISIFLERIYEGQKNKTQNIIKLIVYSLILISFVIIQKDFGTSLVFLFIFLIMVFICQIKYKYIIYSISAFLLTTPFIWEYALNDNRRKRILVFLNPNLDQQGSGYNVIRSKMAIGSGQLFGKNLFHGIQTQNSAVPVKESDFIFSVIGEELGFIGSLLIVLLITFILLRCIYIAKHSRDSYGSFLVIGVVSMLGIHFAENIGMSIGLFPVTGIPLPFISAGGSSMVTSYIAIGIVLSVSMRSQKVLFSN